LSNQATTFSSPLMGGGHSAAARYIYGVAAKLTALGVSGGCAAKYSAARLEELLKGFVPPDAENLLVGLSPADDAAVYKLDDERALVFTLDFFPPLVDDPTEFGTIAATNALNDVFAMGGVPLLALSIAEFPEELPLETVRAILDGAQAQVRAAGAILAGGHTLRADETKYGLAVVGTVHPQAVWPKSGARAGDVLLLTKPLGTGLVLHGFNKGLLGREERAEAVRWMSTLNGDAAAALRPFGPHAVTDVTGFGLFGHAWEMASRSGVRIVLDASALPVLDGALEVARAGERTGGDSRNRDFGAARVEADGVPDEVVTLGFDPQTAGGLLVSVDRAKAVTVEAALRAAGVFVQRVGRIEEGEGVAVGGG
jgi:selenide,water dikinase